MSTIPNHVRNVLELKNLKPGEPEKIVNRIVTVYHNSFFDTDDKIIDFDLIIPEPRFKQDCPKKYQVNKHSHVEEDIERPWFDWYSWHLANWGTKWNAYDGYTIVGKSYVKLVFNTAWSAPIPIIKKLSHMYNVNIRYRYADENYGDNCGEIKLYKGEILPEVKEIENPYKFAKDLWTRY